MNSHRILVADDTEESRSALCAWIRSRGYESIAAVDGAEALARARQDPPDLIISDLLMPGMDGYTLLRRWKTDERLKSVPFIVYTSTYTDEQDRRLALDLGADDFILKPCDSEPFLLRIQNVLHKAERGDISPVRIPAPDKAVAQKEYNEALIRKLEEKAVQFEEINRALQQDIAERRKAEDALTTSENHLRSVVQTAGDAIVTTDDQDRIRFWNGAAETLFGYTPEEAIGQPITNMLPDKFHSAIQHQPERPIVTGQLILGQRPKETFGLRRDGSPFPVEVTVSAWKVKEGRFSTAIVRDISARRRAEEALRKSESQFSTAAVIAHLGPWEYDVEKDVFTFNDQFYAIFKTTAAEVGGYTMSSADYVKRFVHPDETDVVRVETQKAIDTTDPNFSRALEHRILYADGTVGYISVRFFIVKDAKGKTVKTYGVNQDITEQKRAEEALRNSRAMLQTVLDSIPSAVFWKDRDSTYLGGNRTWLESVGCTSLDGVIGKTDYDLPWEKAQADSFREYDKKIMTSGFAEYDIVESFRQADGTTAWAKTNKVPLRDSQGQVIGILGTYENITDRKRAEEALRKSEAQFAQAAAIARLGPWEYDIAKDEFTFNDQFYAIFKTTAAEVGGYTMSSAEYIRRFVHPEDGAIFNQETKRLLLQTTNPRAAQTLEHRILYADGTVGYISVHFFIITDSRGIPLKTFGANQDITDRKRTEQELRKSESQFSNAAVIAHLGPWEYDVEKDLFTFNDQFYAVFKTTAAEIGGYAMSSADYVKRFVHPDESDVVRVETQKAIETTDPNFSRTLEHRILYADGSPGYISVRFFIVKDAKGKTVKTYGVNQDITEQKRAEEEIRKRLGELEGMNRISTILRTAQSLEKMLPDLLSETLAILGSDTGAIWLADSGMSDWRCITARGWMDSTRQADAKSARIFPHRIFSIDQILVSDEFLRDPKLGIAPDSAIPAGWGGAFIPIRSDREAIGVICVALPLPRKITREQVNLLVTLSEMAGTAIQRTQLNEQTRGQVARLNALHEIDTAITASMDLNVTLSYFLDQVVNQLRADAADVLLCDPRLMVLGYIAGRGFRGLNIASTRLRFGEGHAGRAALERRLIHVSIGPHDPLAHSERIAGEGFLTHTAVPLLAKGQVKGVLEVFQRSHFSPTDDWLEFLNTMASQAAIAIENANLFSDLQRVNVQLTRAYDATLEGWSHAMDLRDKETEGHSERVTETTLLLAQKMGLGMEELMHIRRGALLHDLGKLGVPDYILFKADNLTGAEMEIMRRHPALAYELLHPIEYLRPALDIPFCHHERWDGSGYPRGLAGEKIPLAARIFAVADVFDALTSDRPYRNAWPKERAWEYIRERAGKEFDPHVVEVFLSLSK